MGSRGLVLPVLLVVFAVLAGGLMDGVNGTSSGALRRRMAGHHPLPATATIVNAGAHCPATVICGGNINPSFPTCCQNNYLPLGTPQQAVYYCANTDIDYFNCGKCGVMCNNGGFTVGSICCAGNCTNFLIDRLNCGRCGNKCTGNLNCTNGLCGYGG
jgi:hypothetical protein